MDKKYFYQLIYFFDLCSLEYQLPANMKLNKLMKILKN